MFITAGNNQRLVIQGAAKGIGKKKQQNNQNKTNKHQKNPTKKPKTVGEKRAENCSSTCSRINLTLVKFIQAEFFPPLERHCRAVLNQYLFMTHLTLVPPHAPATGKNLQDEQACRAAPHLALVSLAAERGGCTQGSPPTPLCSVLQKELGRVPSAFHFISVKYNRNTGNSSDGDPNILLGESLSPYFLTCSTQSPGNRLILTALRLFLCARHFNPSLVYYKNMFTTFIQTFNS